MATHGPLKALAATAMTMGLAAGSTMAAHATAGSSAASDRPSIAWQNCRDSMYLDFLFTVLKEIVPPSDLADLSTVECGTSKAPLDYSGAQDGDVTLGMVRVPAEGEKKGTVFVNPGGPGGDAIAFALTARPFLAEEVRKHYDIVGVNPRGVGEFNPFECTIEGGSWEEFLAIEKVMMEAPIFPYKQGDYIKMRRANSMIAGACKNTANPTAEYMTTADTARDMDRIREALGEDKLNYVGVSYGSYLGATYANMFPERSRAIVVDSAIDADGYAGTDLATSVRKNTWERVGGHLGMQASLERLATMCAESENCATSAPLMDLHKQAYTGLLERPVMVKLWDDFPEFELTHDLYFAVLNIFMRSGTEALESIPGFVEQVAVATQSPEASAVRIQSEPVRKATMAARHAAEKGESLRPLSVFTPGSDLDRLQALYAEQQKPSTPRADGDGPGDDGPGDDEDFFFAVTFFGQNFQNIMCTDSINNPSGDSWSSQWSRIDAEAPGFGRLWTGAAEPCSTWPYRSKNAYRGPFTKQTPGGVMVVNYTHDPATPLQGAQRLHKSLANSAMVTVDGFGHGAGAGSACARSKVAEYITSGELPAGDSECTADEMPFTK